MQRWIKMTFAFCISVILMSSVTATRTCSDNENAELNQISSQIRASYAPREEKNIDNLVDPAGDDDDEPVDAINHYMEISLTNITEQFYVEVSNDYDNETKTYTHSDTKDNILTIRWDNLSQVTKFTFNVYTSQTTGCPNNLKRTITLRVPRLNSYYGHELCEDIPEFNLCQQYVAFDYIEFDYFAKKTTEYKEKHVKDETKNNEEDKSSWEKIINFITNYKYYFIGGGIIILVSAGVAVAVIVKKRRSSEL